MLSATITRIEIIDPTILVSNDLEGVIKRLSTNITITHITEVSQI